MMKELIGTINAMPKLKSYWKCKGIDFKGDEVFINIKKGNYSATNILTLGYKYKSVIFEEAYINDNEYESINFSNFS